MNTVSKKFAGLFVFYVWLNLCFSQSSVYPNNGTLFDQKVHRLEIIMPPDSFAKLYANPWSDWFYHANFVYDLTDTLFDVGVRVKGNTSRGGKKKSLRIDLDQFKNQGYQGIKKMNINGNLNDVSMIREFLSAYVMNKGGNIALRANPIELYINGVYWGLRTHSEYIDKVFLQSRFGETSGNLYKCSWPADLTWLGSNQTQYKTTNSNSERTYDLKTNELTDDYSDLVKFIDVVNNCPSNDSFKARIQRVFDVSAYLKVLAAEVIIGHWDNYFINKNNYFLYHNMGTGKFVYLPYDMDNTFGVQWGIPNINNRDIHNWGNLNWSKSPLTYKLLSFPEWNKEYELNIRDLLTGAYSLDSMFSKIDFHFSQIQSSISKDPFYTGKFPSDYGFTVLDWQKSTISAWGNHVSFGIKPFIGDRAISAYKQMIFSSENNKLDYQSMSIYPNPSDGRINFNNNLNLPLEKVVIRSIIGEVIREYYVKHNYIDISEIPSGFYLLEIPLFRVFPIEIIR